MCRWMAWLGQPVLIEELLFNTEHGIVDQSLHAFEGGENRRQARLLRAALDEPSSAAARSRSHEAAT